MNYCSKKICSILFLLISFTVDAQEILGNDAQENLFKLGGIDATSGIVRKFDNRYEGVKGSPFWFDSWSTGSLIFENGKHVDNVQLKYNVFEDELIIHKSNEGQFYLPKESVRSFTLQHQGSTENINFVKYIHPKKDSAFQYYRLIVSGTINLIEYIKVVFEKADFEGGYSNDKRYDEFKKYPGFYYFSEPGVKPQKLKSNPNAISKIFPGKNDQVKKYVIKSGLDCTNEKDLIQIFDYYSEIE